MRNWRIFQDIMLEVEGRQAVFDCLEMPEGVDTILLGVIPMERLGLEPDLKSQRLRVLPMNEEQTYLMV